MGFASSYICKLSEKATKLKENGEKPWLKYYDRMPEHLSYYYGSMYDIVHDRSLTDPNLPALEYFDKKYTFKEFIEHVDRVAVALKQFGVVENESVTICMPNIPEAIFIIYAVNKIGAIANVLHPLSKKDDIVQAMEGVNSDIVFATDVTYARIKDIQNVTKIMCNVSESMNIILRNAYNIKNHGSMQYENVVLWSDFIKNGDITMHTHVSRSQDDPAVIIYSGGTTGKQKGIVLSNLCFNSLAEQCKYVCNEAKKGYSILSALPIFHGFGLCICIHVPLAIGLKCILVPRIEVDKLNDLIKSKKPNLLPVVPGMLKKIVSNPYLGPKSFRSVKVILSGGDYLSAELLTEVEKYFRKCGSTANVQIGYGLSEATAFVSATNESIRQTGSIGIPNPDNVIRIFEPNTDVERDVDGIGEICVKGPSVMLGYINNEEETDKVLIKHYDGDLWLHTGDLGYMDSDGVIHYTSRLKRLIISNGNNIYPVELEDTISKCKYVDSCVVVGIKDEIRQEIPKAVIVLKPGTELTPEIEQEIKDYCMENITRYAVPKVYEFREALPVTKIGKVDYRALQ